MSIRSVQVWLGMAVLGLGLAPVAAGAQGFGGQGRHGGRQGPPAAAAPDAPKLAPEPSQRLDPGAMLCKTEEALQQHQAAVLARLNGTEGTEPVGCRVVQTRLAVAVLGRHGPSHTEVRLPGTPEQIGWTDAMVRP